MSKDIGPFGQASIEAGARQLDRAYDRHEMTLEAVAGDVLSAAVGALDREALVEQVTQAMRREIGSCREWGHVDRCGEPAEYVLWGKLIDSEGLGPRCYEHAAVHVSRHALAPNSDHAVIHVGTLARVVIEALFPTEPPEDKRVYRGMGELEKSGWMTPADDLPTEPEVQDGR